LLYQDTGAYAKARAALPSALAITEKALGPTHPATAAALNDLAFLYHLLYQRALVISEKTLPEHPETADVLNNLAVLYSELGAYEKAQQLFERALGIDEINTVRFLFNGDESRGRCAIG
jgi:tetratricopeptide (TPR) repeat protein